MYDLRIPPADDAGVARAIELARHAVRDDRRGIAGVAERAGVKRSALSMVLSGTYPARPGRVAALLLRALDGWTCPYTSERILPEACAATALAAAPTHRPDRMAHWRACQQCPSRPASIAQEPQQ